MRERGQASVETVALVAAALALAAALLLGVVGLAPPLASALGHALSHELAPGAPTAPGLDGFERQLLDAATSPDDDGPTLLDLRTRLRSRLARPAADAAFAAVLRPLVERALAAHAIDSTAAQIELVDGTTEDAWLQEHFHPGLLGRVARLALGSAGSPGAIFSLADDLGLLGDDATDGIEPGHAAGDVVVEVAGGSRRVVLRRRSESGLTIVAAGRPGARGSEGR